MTHTYEISPRPANLGGGYRLRLLEDGQEMGGGVFPISAYQDEENADNAAHADAQGQGEDWVSLYTPR